MKNKKSSINHLDITRAIQKFKKDGGLIRRLPAQVVPKGVLVGGRLGMFESIFEPSTAGSGGSSATEDAAAN